MYILYGTEIPTPIIYKNLDTIMLKIINSKNNGRHNEFYQELKKQFNYSNDEYNIYYSDDKNFEYKILSESNSNELLEFIYNENCTIHSVYIVNDKVLYECLLYCRTIYKFVEEQMFIFNLDNDLLCDINVLIED